MPGIDSSLNIGITALQTALKRFDVHGHNIANADNEAYNRQTGIVVSTADQSVGGIPFGTGSKFTKTVRDTDVLGFAQLERASQNLAQSDAKRRVLQQAEALISTSDTTGLPGVLNQFWDSWQELANSPESPAAREDVIRMGEFLSRSFSDTLGDMENLQSKVNVEVENAIDQVNLLSAEIAVLNERIATTETGLNPANDFRDQREQKVLELKELIEVQATEQSNGMVLVEGNGIVLVSNNRSFNVVAGEDSAGNSVVTRADNGDQVTTSKGAIAGFIDARDNHLNVYIDRLNDLSQAVIKEVNKIHSQGAGINSYTSHTSANQVLRTGEELVTSESGLPFFADVSAGSFKFWVNDSNGTSTATTITISDSTSLDSLATAINAVDGVSATVSDGKINIQSGSGKTFGFSNDTSNVLMALGLNSFFTGKNGSDIAVHSDLVNNSNLVAAGRLDSTSGVLSPGDSQNAFLISEVRHNLTLDSNTKSMDDFIADTVSLVGIDTSAAISNVENHEAVHQQVKTQHLQEVGVSVDEELLKMLQVQQSFQAASRVISTTQSLLDVIISL